MFNALVQWAQLIGVVVLILILARLSQIESHLRARNPDQQTMQMKIQEAKRQHDL